MTRGVSNVWLRHTLLDNIPGGRSSTEPISLSVLRYELQEAEATHEEAQIRWVVARKRRAYMVQT